MRFVKVAVIQMACSEDHAENVDKAENLVREAALQGANIILLPELFETIYFVSNKIQNFSNGHVLLRNTRFSKEWAV